MSATKPDLTTLYDQLALNDSARAVAEQIRSQEPVRRAASNHRNVVTRWPSHKMGQTVQAESRYPELSLILSWEWRDDVYEYYDQPYSLPIRYCTNKGRKTGMRHTCDFFLITRDYVGFVEAKSDKEAREIADKSEERICLDGNGHWRAPAAEAAAHDLGLEYFLYVPESIDVLFCRNIRYLWQYFISHPTLEQVEQIESLQCQIDEDKYAHIDSLFANYTSEVIYYAVAHQYVYFDLSNDLLTSPANACVYADPLYAQATRNLSTETPRLRPSALAEINVGTPLIWDGQEWVLVNIGDGKYTLQDANNNLCTVPEEHWTPLLRSGRLAPQHADPNEAPLQRLVDSASPTRVVGAVKRAEKMRAYERGENTIEDRTYRRWRQRCSEAETAHGDPFYGLLDHRDQRGNRAPRIPEADMKVLRDSLEHDYRSRRAVTIKAAYREYRLRAEQENVQALTYESYRRWARALDTRSTVAARSGARAATNVGRNLHTGNRSRTIYRPTVSGRSVLRTSTTPCFR